MNKTLKFKKQFFVIILGIIIGMLLMIGLSGDPVQSVAYGAESQDETVLAFSSDVHTKATAYTSSNRLGSWIDKMKTKYGHIDAMSFAGDMAEYNVTESQFWTDTQNAMDVVDNKGVEGYYTTGNHEYDPGNFTPSKNATTAKYSLNTQVKEGDNYIIYCMGSSSSTQEYPDSQITALDFYLDNVGNDKPIFIVTHYPLHYVGPQSARTTVNAADVIDVLNDAATGGTPDDPSDDKKIVFLWGHNHTNANSNETNYDQIFKAGDQLQPGSSSAKKTIDFYYAAAGCMSDSEKGSGSAAVKGKGLIATVDDRNLLSFTYYDANAKDVTEGGPFEETEPVAVERFSIDEAAGAGDLGLTIEAGRKLQLNTSVEPAEANDYTVTWSSSDNTVATVDNTGKVTGVSEGQAEITATLVDNFGGDTHTASIDIEVIPRSTAGTPYVLTNTITPGKNYLIVSANSGDAYALMNDNGNISKVDVTIDGDTIYADDEDIVFEAQGSGTTINDLHNGNRYLKASSSGLQLNTTAGESRPWEYDGSSHKLTNYKSSSGSATHYYVYYENNAFATSTSTSSTHVIYLFEETEPDVSYNVSFKVANGKWDDDSTADKTVTVSGPEGSVIMSEDQIPAVGSKPNSGYKAGSWNVTPNTTTSLTGNVTYTYTYEEEGSEKAYVLTNELKAGKNYIISSANSGTAHVLTSNSTTAAEVTIDGDTIYTDDTSIVFKMGEEGGPVNYIGNEDGYVNHTSDNYLSFISTPPSGITWTYDGSYLTYKNGNDTYYLYYKSGTNYNRYRIKSQSTASSEQLIYLFEEVQTDVSHTVTFQVENGKWNDETTQDKTVELTGSANTELKLSADQIPAVGGKPDTHYKAGAWDVTPDTNTAIAGDTTYKYTYEFVDHDWDDGVVNTPATCTEDGEATYTCSVGGETKTETIPALGHNMTEHQSAPASCTQDGNEEYWSCSRCGKFFADEQGLIEVEENSWIIPASHDWSKPTYTWSDDNSSVTAEYHCTVYGCGEEVTETVNTTSEVTKDATCTEAGETKYTAEFTDVNLEDQTKVDATKPEATGHDWSDPTYTWNDDYSKVTAEYHCTAGDCDEEVTETVDTTSEVTKDATCTEAGETKYTAEFTDEKFEDQTKVDNTKPEATGHDWSKPTYTWSDDNSSVTAEYHCTAIGCNEEVTETAAATADVTQQATCTQHEITTWTSAEFENEAFKQQTKTEQTGSALGHNMTAHPAVEVTCTEDGNSAYWSCNRCHKFFSDAAGDTEVEEDSWVIEANGHIWDEGTVTTAPTCTEKGVKTFNCENCDAARTEDINALGHNMQEHAAVEATCTAAGNTAYWSCDRCIKFFSDAEGETEVAIGSWVLPATGHNMTEHPAKEATCTEAGNEAYWNCDRCHKFFSDAAGNTEVEEDSWVTDALGHHMTAHAAVEATCTEAGNSAYWSCDRCSKFFEDEEGTKEIEEDSWVTNAKGHNMTGHAAVEATCTEAGNSAYWSCDQCHKFFEDEDGTKEIEENSWITNAKGHNMTGHAAKEATCTEAGNEAYWSCDQCHKFFEDEEGTKEIEEDSWVIEANGHSWDEGTVTTAPTCTQKGVKTFGCKNCDATRTEDIDVLGHNMTEHAAVEATCTAAGNTAYWSCDRCSKFFSDAEGETEVVIGSWITPATGHNMTEHPAKEETCTETGNTAYWSCDQCHKFFEDEDGTKEIEEDSWVIDAKGHHMTAHPAVEPTTTEAGNSAYWSCDQCGKFFSDEEGNNEIEENSWIIDAKGVSEERYIEVDQFTNGKDYIVAVTKDGSAVYAIANAGAQNHVSSETLSVEPASGSDPAYIVTDKAAVVWNYTSSDQFLTNESLHLNRAGSNGNYYPIADSAGREAHYVNGELYLKKSSSNSTYYITCNSGTFGLSENESGGVQVRLFEKTIVDVPAYKITFKNEDGTVLQQLEVAKGRHPSYTGATPTKEEDHDYTYTFAGWTDGTDNYGIDDTLPAASAATTYTARYDAQEKHHHSWDEGTVTTQPTCTQKGVKTFHCSGCDETKTEDIDALGHNMTEHAAKEATCTEAGNSKYWSCDRCHKFFSDADASNEINESSWVIVAKGHSWDEGTVTTQPTCTAKGVKTFNCENCDATRTEDINALGHHMTEHAAVEATCTEAGSSAYWSCDQCHKFFSDAAGETEIAENSWVIDAKGHNMQEHAAKEATCTEAGNSAYWSCDKCNKYFSDAAGETEIAENSWVTNAKGHNMTEHADQEATCTEAGNTAYWSCDQCHKFFEDEDGTKEIEEDSWVIDANGHNMTEHAAVEATCTQAGSSAYWSCDQCNKFFSDENGSNAIEENSWVIDAKGHHMTEHAAKEATCTEAGSSKYWSCDQCNKFFSDAAGETEIAENSWVINANGHSWDEGTVTTQPTCTAKGVKTFSCKNCDATRTEDVNALGHNMTGHAAVEATCTEAGNSAYWSCDQCHKFFEDEDGTKEIEENSWVTNAKGHNMTGHPAVEATCTAAGNSAYWSCDQCHKFFSDAEGNTEIEENSWVTDAKGHNMTEHAAKEATCTEAGNSKYWSCDRCHKFFSDAAGNTEIEENSWVANAKGHNMTGHPAVEATCTEAGNSAYWSCDQCSKFFSDEEGSNVIEENSWVINAKGHSWDEGTVTTQPTCTAKGVRTFNCKNCDAARTEDVDALGHNMQEHPAVEATCTAAGNTAYWSCDRCMKFFSDAEGETEIVLGSWVIDAKGHNMTEHPAVEATCTQAGNTAYWSCDQCSKFFEDKDGTKEIEEDSWVINAKGHHMTEHAAVEATCTQAGNSAYWSCDQCSKFFSDENGNNAIEENSWVINAKGHNMTGHAAVEATCTQAGNSAYWSCDQCSKFFSDENGNNAIEENSWVINAKGHNMTEHAAKEATCTKAGNSAYWSCDQCHKFFEDKDGTKEIEEDSWVIDAKGHNMTEHPAVEATCAKAGNSAYWSCDKCNKFFEDKDGTKEIEEGSWVIDTTDHDYGEWTELDENQHHRFCSRDASHEQKENHVWNAGTVTKAATTTSTGIKTYTCTVCNATKTETIPKKAKAVKPIIVAKAVAKGTTTIDFAWIKVAGAKRYIVYLSFCNANGMKSDLKKIATVNSSKLKYRKTKLKKNASYKFKVVAQKKVNGKFKTIASSPVGHIFSSGYQGVFTNPKSIKVNRTKVVLKKGKTFKVKATVKKLKAKMKMMPTSHTAVVRYITSNSKIAKVSKKGKITAKAKGRCDIYAITQNGIWKKIKVTVK